MTLWKCWKRGISLLLVLTLLASPVIRVSAEEIPEETVLEQQEVVEEPEENGPFNKIEKMIKNTAKRIETEAEKVSLERFGINEKGIKERFTPKKSEGSKKKAGNKNPSEDVSSKEGGTEE